MPVVDLDPIRVLPVKNTFVEFAEDSQAQAVRRSLSVGCPRDLNIACIPRSTNARGLSPLPGQETPPGVTLPRASADPPATTPLAALAPTTAAYSPEPDCMAKPCSPDQTPHSLPPEQSGNMAGCVVSAGYISIAQPDAPFPGHNPLPHQPLQIHFPGAMSVGTAWGASSPVGDENYSAYADVMDVPMLPRTPCPQSTTPPPRHRRSTFVPESPAKTTRSSQWTAKAVCTCRTRHTDATGRNRRRLEQRKAGRTCPDCHRVVCPDLQARLWCSFYLRSPSGFDLVPIIIGKGGQNTRSIAAATSAKIRVRGKGSGHLEFNTGKEAPTPLMLVVATEADNKEGFLKAMEMTTKLMWEVQTKYIYQCSTEGREPSVRPLFTLGNVSDEIWDEIAARLRRAGTALPQRHYERDLQQEGSGLQNST